MAKIVLLDSIRSMQNIGAIFRNADWAWFEKILLTGYCPTPPRNDISKTALSAETWIDWEYYKDPVKVVEEYKNKWYKIYSIELTSDAIEYTELFWEKEENIILILWNEINGVSKKLLDLSCKKVIIPMRWKKESLNVSVAAGIVMYAV